MNKSKESFYKLGLETGKREVLREVENIIKKNRIDGIGFDYYGLICDLNKLKEKEK